VTFRLVSQCLNQPRYRILLSSMMPPQIIFTTSSTATGRTLSSCAGGIEVCLSVSERNWVTTLHLIIHLHQIRNWDLFSLLLLLLFIFLCVSIAQNHFPLTSSLVVARRPYVIIHTAISTAGSLSGNHFKLNANCYLAFTRLVIMIRHGSK
jgi:hypothetical protein